MLLFLGLLLAISIASFVLNAALLRAQQGYEDETGFHVTGEIQAAGDDFSVRCSKSCVYCCNHRDCRAKMVREYFQATTARTHSEATQQHALGGSME